MSELRERCRLLAICVCRELRVGQINGTPKWCGVWCVFAVVLDKWWSRQP